MSKLLYVSENGKEICVLCHEETDVDFTAPVPAREHYVEGCGQHCESCCAKKHLC